MPALVFHLPFVPWRTRGGAPARPSAVLLVVPDRPHGSGAGEGALDPAIVRRAVRLAATGNGAVTVVATVRLHGSGLGAPHPGLLPTERERDQGRQAVAGAVAALEKLGASADGQIVVTRSPGRAIARVARARAVSAVLVGVPEQRGLRRLIEGDLAAHLRRRLRTCAAVESAGG